MVGSTPTCSMMLFAMMIPETEKPVQQRGAACTSSLCLSIVTFRAPSAKWSCKGQYCPASPGRPFSPLCKSSPQTPVAQQPHPTEYFTWQTDIWSSSTIAQILMLDRRQRLKGIAGSEEGCQQLVLRLTKASKMSQLQAEMDTSKQLEELVLKLQNWGLAGCDQLSDSQLSHLSWTSSFRDKFLEPQQAACSVESHVGPWLI